MHVCGVLILFLSSPWIAGVLCFFLSNAHVNSVLVYMITATLENDSPLHFESICCWELGGQIGSFIHY